MGLNQPQQSSGSSQSSLLGKRLAKDAGLGSSEQKCAELAQAQAEGMLRSTSSCLPTAPPAAQRFKSLTATHTPGTLELNMVAQQPSEATPESGTSQQELIMAGQ